MLYAFGLSKKEVGAEAVKSCFCFATFTLSGTIIDTIIITVVIMVQMTMTILSCKATAHQVKYDMRGGTLVWLGWFVGGVAVVVDFT